jgi:hypothetical protein
MSLIRSAQLNGHDPHAYLKDILTRLPTHKARDISALLPHRWQPPVECIEPRILPQSLVATQPTKHIDKSAYLPQSHKFRRQLHAAGIPTRRIIARFEY